MSALTTALVAASGSLAHGAQTWTYTELAPERGIDFRHRYGGEGFVSILDDTGAGAALFDFDGDGLLDVYLVDGGRLAGLHAPGPEDEPPATNRLYRNLGGMRFEDATERAGVGDRGYGMGVAVGDYDGDGDADLYVLNYGPNVLYRNEGDGTFRDVTRAMGVAGPASSNGAPVWSVSGLFFDFDGDRDLDLLVANYLAFDPDPHRRPAPGEPYPGPESYAPQPSVLYRNDGERFVDVSLEHGVGERASKSMGISAGDFDGDGRLELFEAADTVPNALFRAGGDGRWQDGARRAGVALDADGCAMSSMHGTVGDYDDDGLLDLFVANLQHGCLYRNLGEMRFEEASNASGVASALRGLHGWASELGDFDLDGDLDLLVVNGGAFDAGARQPLKLLLNEGEGRFRDVSAELGPDFAAPMVGRGAAFGDLDGDGDLDFVVNRKDAGGAAALFRNDLPRGKRWLALELEGTRSSREPVGARVTLVAGGRAQVREMRRSGSYLSQSDPRVHFGLGSQARVDSLVVRWPSGREQSVEVGEVDRVLRVREPSE